MDATQVPPRPQYVSSPATKKKPKGLAPVSKKRRKLNREAKPTRDQLRKDFKLCMKCGKRKATDIHEIPRGCNRENALKYREALLYLDRDCHEELGDYALWPPSRQYALKLVADPEHYDRELLNALRGKDTDAISASDVARHLTLKEI